MDTAPQDKGPDYDAWVRTIQAHEAQGTLFFAYDAAERALADPRFSRDRWIRHRAVLCLARAGATEAAEQAFEELELQAELDDPEIATLRARLMKDRSLRAQGKARIELLSHSASAYEDVFREAGSYYPAVNAATLWALAGRQTKANDLARAARVLIDADRPRDELGHYFRLASLAECYLVEGNENAAAKALAEAADYARYDLAARGTTRRQLRRLIADRGLDAQMLNPLAPPPVMHYTGHMVAPPGQSGRLTTGDLDAVRGAIEHALDRLRPGFAYGGLACGGDLLFVEALLERGAEVTGILPFEVEDFIAASVQQGGPEWTKRFWNCFERLKGENRLLFATEDAYQGDDNLFVYADEYAMGLAIMRAQHIEADAVQVTVWDGRETSAVAGTYPSRVAWQATGRAQVDVAWEPSSRPAETPPPAATAATPALTRERRALLFGDFKGFSKLPDRLLPRFVESVLGAVKRVIDRHPVLTSNTWGDAVYLVLEDAAPAVRCALDLQREVGSLDWACLGFDVPLQLRLGGHYGPVYYAQDPVLGTPSYFGAHVSRAARVEPITPPGGVYVTEQFATKLSLSHSSDFQCEYVGVKDAPKEYGQLPLSLVRSLE